MKNPFTNAAMPAPQMLTFVINPELKTIPEIVEFLGFLKVSFPDTGKLPAEIQNLLDKGIIINTAKLIQP